MQKIKYRYRQTEHAYAQTVDVLGRASSGVGLSQLMNAFMKGLNRFARWISKALRSATRFTVERLSGAAFIGPIIRSYAFHYEGVHWQSPERLSAKMKGFFARWSIKFSPEYYEVKENATDEGAARV